MKEPVMSSYAMKQECLEARADFFEDQRDTLLQLTKRILGASLSKNNGAYSGEAILCPYFEEALSTLIKEIEDTKL